MNPTANRSLIKELTTLTVVLLVLTRAVTMLKGISIIDSILPVVVAVLFLYSPILVIWRRGRKIDFLDDGVGDYFRSFIVFLITSLIVFPLFLIGAHLWQMYVFKMGGFKFVEYPHFWSAAAFQIFLVALPEEFYFRGYFQSAMDMMCEKRWKILGVKLGWGWIITSLVFALAHSIVYYRWWHFAIFFPALLFGYLRERTGTITASVLFHAASNLIMQWFVRCY
ncbi:MAG: CPBP family intramembrane metalloprotease [Deltaproteobacteria bacterium]|jgi:uncharacterized protein|nr:CPBP family intramembrane metalloprotease [Deltaproteobacteria bacterium]